MSVSWGKEGDDVEHMSPVVPKRLRDTDIKGKGEREQEIDTRSVSGLFTDIKTPKNNCQMTT